MSTSVVFSFLLRRVCVPHLPPLPTPPSGHPAKLISIPFATSISIAPDFPTFWQFFFSSTGERNTSPRSLLGIIGRIKGKARLSKPVSERTTKYATIEAAKGGGGIAAYRIRAHSRAQ